MSTWHDDENASTPKSGMWREHIDDPGSEGRAVLKRGGIAVDEVLALFAEVWSAKRILVRFPILTEVDLRACADFHLERTAERMRNDPARTLAEAEAGPFMSHEELVRRLDEADQDEP